MCGIGGWLGTMDNSEDWARQLAAAMCHRGPDARRVRTWDFGALSHARLSIIDLSQAAEEPLSNEDGTVWTVFNGEIYNHHSLRADLESKGHSFRSRTDAEVLPHLYEEYGADLARQLQGMFAFAVLDLPRRRLILARDHFGIKPLFYGRLESDRGPSLAFASEINALRLLPDLDQTPSLQAIGDFLALSYVPPPQTLFSGILAVEPCQLVDVHLRESDLQIEKSYYHQWQIAPDPAMTEDEAVSTARTLLKQAVSRQIESDVPLGSMLSGGIDSSLVSALAQDAVDGTLASFNVQFPDAAYDETGAALSVARHIGSDHHVLPMPETDLSWEACCSILRSAGQPFGDTSIFAAAALSVAMREQVKVALSGDGGDEGFGGYQTYHRLADAVHFSAIPAALQSPVVGALARSGKLLGSRASSAAGALAQVSRGPVAYISHQHSWIREPERRRLLGQADILPPERWYEPLWRHVLPRGASALEKWSAVETESRIRVLLAGDLLPKVDTASMRVGLEVRVPMLDLDLFSFALTLPHRLKTVGGETKPVLRKAASALIPPDVARLPKRGFGVPVDRLMPRPVRDRLYETVTAPANKLSGYVDPLAYEPLLNNFRQGTVPPGLTRDGLYQRAIMLLSLHLFLDVGSAQPATALSAVG